MTKIHRNAILKLLQLIRKSALRLPLLKLAVKLHNFAYHSISFLASHGSLHPKHDILQYHKFFIDNVSATDRVLDIGSGNGAVANDIANKAKEVVGIDIRPQNILKAEKAYRKNNLKFIQGDATTETFKDNFDVIVLSNVLEHIEDRIHFLQKIQEIAPKILIRVPMVTRDWVTVFKKNQGLEYRLDDTHYIEYSSEIFENEIKQSGLQIKDTYIAFGELYAIVIKD